MIAAEHPPAETARRQQLRAVASDPFLTRPEVEAECGIGRSTIYRMMEAGTFPRPRRIGGGVRWPLSSIEAWKAKQPTADTRD